MLDTIKFKIPVSPDDHQMIFAGKPLKGGKASRRRSCRRLPDSFTGKKFQICPGNTGNAVVVEASLPRLLQGHNVYGPNKLRRLCFAVAKQVYRGLGLKRTSSRLQRLKQHDYEVLRTDLTGSFDVGSQENVKAVMKEIRVQLLAQGLDIVVHEGPDGIETIYLGKNSKRSTLKFYNKYLELLANPIPAAVPGRDLILEYAKGLVRVEYTMRSAELRDARRGNRNGLDRANRWDKETVRILLHDRLARLKFTGEVRDSIDIEEVEGMKPAHRMAYLLWHDGIDLRKYFPRTTYARYRKQMLEKHQIDIGRPADQPGTMLSLAELLFPQNLKISNWPMKLQHCGAIYGTKEWQSTAKKSAP